MKHYTQLTQEQRYQIYAYMKAGYKQTEVADFIGVHKSTVSRELRRNSGLRGYRPKQGHAYILCVFGYTVQAKNCEYHQTSLQSKPIECKKFSHDQSPCI